LNNFLIAEVVVRKLCSEFIKKLKPKLLAYSSDINTTRSTTMASNTTAKEFEFCEDIFKHILSYTESLPTCDVEKCKFVATEECGFCHEKCCKKHLASFQDGSRCEKFCNKCAKNGVDECVVCYNNLTDTRCGTCYLRYCGECAGVSMTSGDETGLCNYCEDNRGWTDNEDDDE
jgi:hypothetical protein